MSVKRVILIFALIMISGLTLISGSVSAVRYSDKALPDPIQRIENDFSAGLVTLDEKAILLIQAIKDPMSLPSHYSAGFDEGEKLPDRCATMVIVDIYNHWDELSRSTQSAVGAMLTRHSTAFTYNSPSGFFKLHYDISGEHAVPPADGNANTIPDYVEKCAAYCDSALETHRDLGYLDPPSDLIFGGDGKFDVYFEEMPYYGYAVPEGDGPALWNDKFSYFVLNRDFIGFPQNNDPEGNVAGAAKATAGHELHHCVQFGYDPNEAIWFMELGATWMEDITFNQVDDNYNYLGTFMNDPEKSLMEMTLHMYASFIWASFLSEKFDTSLIRAVWEGARSSDVYTTLSDTLQGRYGWTQDSAFAEFEAWNFATGVRDDGLHYEEGSEYPAVTIDATYSGFPVLNQVSPKNPAGYAATYIKFLPGMLSGGMAISFNGDDSRQWGAWLVKTDGSNNHEFVKLSLASGTYTDTIHVDSIENYESLTLIGVNLTQFGAAASFTYSARLTSPFSIASEIITDTAVYSGGGRDFEYQVVNTSGFGDVIRVKYSDDMGWVTLDSIDVFLTAMDTIVYSIPVMPPVSTPLGVVSNLLGTATS